MSVTIKVVSIDDKFFHIEAYCNKTNGRVMKTPMVLKLKTKKSIEAVIKKECKVFQQPVWQGYNVEFLVDVV